MQTLARTSESVVTAARRMVEKGIERAMRRRRAATRVDRLMSTGIQACSPEQQLSEAAKIMWERDCGCVPVIDEARRIVGMITDRDICMSAYHRGATLRDIPIHAAMSRRVLTVRPDDTVESAEALMRRAQVRRLPVADAQGRLLGILSLNDIAVAAEREQRSARDPQIDLRDVALTLSAISRRRTSPEHAARALGAAS